MRKKLFSRILIVVTLFSLIILTACSGQQPAATEAEPAAVQPEAAPIPTVEPAAPAVTAPSASLATVQVAIKGFKFIPAQVSIKEGDTIVWTNEDSASHIIKNSDGALAALKSAELFKGDTYSFTFTKTGAYDYICGLHPFMKGAITVG